jgi:C4-dicarboxylate-specific signal transduction histidine kinase
MSVLAHIDSEALHQMLDNILCDAVDALIDQHGTRATCRLTVDISRDGADIKLEFANDFEVVNGCVGSC